MTSSSSFLTTLSGWGFPFAIIVFIAVLDISKRSLLKVLDPNF